jgi:hypothetical protein
MQAAAKGDIVSVEAPGYSKQFTHNKRKFPVMVDHLFAKASSFNALFT